MSAPTVSLKTLTVAFSPALRPMLVPRSSSVSRFVATTATPVADWE